MADYIPGTDILLRHLNECQAAKGKYRVVVLDVMSGNSDILVHDDHDVLEVAQKKASAAIDGTLSLEGGPKVNKAYVFDEHGSAVYEAG